MWQELTETILQSDFQAVLGLCLLGVIVYILYSERNQNKDGENLTLIIKALSDPLSRLMIVQERLVESIETQGASTRAVINAQTSTIMDAIAITQNKLTASDVRLKDVQTSTHDTATWVAKQPQVQAQVMASIAELDSTVNEKANDIMKPIEVIAEIKTLLQEIKTDIATLQASISEQQSAINNVNARVGVVEQRTREVIEKITKSEVENNVSKATKQLATDSNHRPVDSGDSIGSQSSAGASPVGGVS